MTDYHRDYIYCSSLLPVESLEAEMARPGAKLRDMRDPADSPEDDLIKRRDRDRLNAWIGQLRPPLFEVAKLLMDGMKQSAIAQKLELTEAAISKRVARIRQRGAHDLADLRASPLWA